MRYDLTDLRLLVWIADLGSFAAAARRANLSISALSDRIKRLEEGAGVPLLERSARGSVPTAAGLELITHARAVQLQVDRLNFAVASWKHRDSGVVRLAANSHALAGSLPDAISQFVSQHPGVFLQLREDLSDAIGRSVSEGTADIGVAGASAQFPNLELISFNSGTHGLLVPASHALAERRTISFSETLDLPQISLEEPSAISLFLSERANRLGRDLVVPIRLRSFEGVCRMVSAGAGVSILPSTTVNRSTLENGTRFIPLDDDWAPCSMVLCLPRDRPVAPIVRLLAEEIVRTEGVRGDPAVAWRADDQAVFGLH